MKKKISYCILQKLYTRVRKALGLIFVLSPLSCLVVFEHSNRTILKTSRLTRACHCPFNALSLQGAPLKGAPNLHSPSHCPGTETDWASSVIHRILHFEQWHSFIITFNSVGQVQDVQRWRRAKNVPISNKKIRHWYFQLNYDWKFCCFASWRISYRTGYR